MFFVKPTWTDLVRMLWWNLWNPPPPQELQLPPFKKLEAPPTDCCPLCRRPYNG